ncbi:SdpI family protein [Polymorphospora rubra]|uniref:SdpI/YhfL protein family protein n=1 Tax=Polymorphospora rubra TaxID=338584 RepID=A0A810NDX4_9ACTN|nr:SdpI family protein [Polymorphospora rubra]BCJ70259.1 hypothetical protein Prubr_72800 [Polymorphospora rubra]
MTELLVAKVILAVVMALSGALIVWAARATASGRLGRNEAVGIRTASTLSSDQAWLAAHRAARSVTEAAGWSAVATAVVVPFTPGPGQLVTVVGIGTAALLVLALVGARRGVRAATALPPSDRPS